MAGRIARRRKRSDDAVIAGMAIAEMAKIGLESGAQQGTLSVVVVVGEKEDSLLLCLTSIGGGESRNQSGSQSGSKTCRPNPNARGNENVMRVEEKAGGWGFHQVWKQVWKSSFSAFSISLFPRDRQTQ